MSSRSDSAFEYMVIDTSEVRVSPRDETLLTAYMLDKESALELAIDALADITLRQPQRDDYNTIFMFLSEAAHLHLTHYDSDYDDLSPEDVHEMSLLLLRLFKGIANIIFLLYQYQPFDHLVVFKHSKDAICVQIR